MVQLKYYGDDRDYFKYDLISFILKNCDFKQYGFIPMLTEHRYDNEGNILPKPSNCKSKPLLSFIATHSKPDLKNWELWLKQYIPTYNSRRPINTNYFSDSSRVKYWEDHKEIISSSNALIFFDPDTGIQAGRDKRIKEDDKEKYILNNEIARILDQLSSTSAFVIYQHLQKNKNKREQDIKNKYNKLIKIDPALKISIYHEEDLAFIFITKSTELNKAIHSKLNAYNNNSTVSPRGVYKNA